MQTNVFDMRIKSNKQCVWSKHKEGPNRNSSDVSWLHWVVAFGGSNLNSKDFKSKMVDDQRRKNLKVLNMQPKIQNAKSNSQTKLLV